MDTVTRAEMAIVMAEEGGIGIIDRGFRPGDIEPQVREALKVKRTQHGVIPDPLTIAPGALLEEAALAMQRSRVGTLVVVQLKGAANSKTYELPAQVVHATPKATGDFIVGCALVTRLTNEDLDALL